MTKTTKKPAAPRTFTPATGIGFDLAVNPSGYGLKNEPAVVLCLHPIYGTRVYGPLVTIDAARAWVCEADETLVACYGSSRDWSLHATTMEVDGHYRD
jgi:hypothetical protein